MIDVRNLTKLYLDKKGHEITANHNISLSIGEGEIVGLLGHNGAGKTTLVNQMLGLVRPTAGEITILGHSIVSRPEQGRYLCSVQPQSQLSLGELTPRTAVETMGLLRGGDPGRVKQEAIRLFEALDITEWADKESVTLSGGVKRLTAFCMAVIHSNQIIILDEPTNDVDPVRRRYLWQEIRRLTEHGRGVILVTHNVTEAEQVVNRIVIMHEGEILADGTSAQIRGTTRRGLKLEYRPSVGMVVPLPRFAGASGTVDDKQYISILREDAGTALTWARTALEDGLLCDYTISETTLEDIYVRMTERRRVS